MAIWVHRYQKGQKFTTLVEERDVAYFPAIVEWARGEPGQACFLVGSVPLLSGLVPRLRLTDPILPFLDLAMDISRSRSLSLPGMRPADDQRISFHMRCRHCRLSEQHLHSNAGVFGTEEANGIL
jgi:hypothetical protein